MDDWQRMLKGSLREPEQIAVHFGLDKEAVARVSRVFKTLITPYYASLIRHKGDALYRQVVPDPAELREESGDLDPLSEDKDSPVPSIIHRYPDRLLFLVSENCHAFAVPPATHLPVSSAPILCDPALAQALFHRESYSF